MLSHVQLCDTVDCSPPGSSVHGIFQTRILHRAAISYSRGSSWPRDQTQIFCISCIGWRREWQPTPVFLPGESHGQRSLAGYSPWRFKESDMTEWLTLHWQADSYQCTTVWPRNSTPRFIPKRNKNIHPHKNLYMNVQSSIIHNYQKVKTTQISIN